MTAATAWAESAVMAPPGVRRLSLGGREAVFCERRQQLCELPPELAAFYDELAAGAPLPVSRAGLAAEWIRNGWLVPRVLFERLARPPSDVLALRVGDLSIRIEVRSTPDSQVAQHLRQTFRQFADDSGANAERWDVVPLGETCFVLGSQLPLRVLSPAQVTPEIKARLTARLCRTTAGGGLLLHSAMLERDGCALLLAGPPGAGKTTLAVALALRGLGYLTDDVVSVTRDGLFEGVRFSPALKSGAWPLLQPRLPALQALEVHVRADEQVVRYLPVDLMPPGASAAPAMAICLDRRAAGRAALEPLDPLSALTELLGSAFSAEHRLPAETLARLAERFAGMICARLIYSNLDDAVELLLARFSL